LKANPGKASVGTAGIGSGEHVSSILFQTMTDTNFQLVPYRGAAPAMQDLVAGQIDMMIEAPASFLPQLHAGSVKAFAVTGKNRLAAAPAIPTVDEAGLTDLILFLGWLFGPKARRRTLSISSMLQW
jgi:tripartite-type tricarboxylate transporter receptor subunit TctC